MCASVLASCSSGKFVGDSGTREWVGRTQMERNGRVRSSDLMTHRNATRTLLIVAFPAVISKMGCKYLCSSARMTFDSFAKANNPLKII